MGKKFICLIAAIVCIAMCLTSCGGTSVGMDNSYDKVSSNGGFVVETGDYVYFINGVESYSTTYKTGKVTKAALMRTKKSNLAKLGGEGLVSSDYETVVSKLIVSSDYDAGYYIYGEYVYYAVPSAENDKTGTVKSDKLNFFRTKLDGSKTSSKIAKEDYNNDAQFRFISSGEKVYLVVYSSGIFVYDAIEGEKVYSYEKTIDEFMFDENNASTDLWFTIKPVNENLYDPDSDSAQQANYQEIHRVSLGAEVVESVVLSGAGNYAITNPDGEFGNEQEGSGIGLTGATFDLIRHKDGVLYFSYTYLDSTLAAVNYVALEDSKIGEHKDTWAAAQQSVINSGDKNAAAIFADNSIILSKDCIVYLSTTYGLLKYDYTKPTEGDFGVTRVFDSATILSATISGVVGDYLYYYDASNNYYRVNLKKAVEGEKVEEFRINSLAVNSSWYAPEVVKVGETEYFIAVYTNSVYGSYCYAIDMTATENAYNQTAEEEKDEFYNFTETKESVKGIVEKNLLGVMTDSDNTAYNDYVDDLESESTSSSESVA